jgi:hypothetical protein
MSEKYIPRGYPRRLSSALDIDWVSVVADILPPATRLAATIWMHGAI